MSLEDILANQPRNGDDIDESGEFDEHGCPDCGAGFDQNCTDECGEPDDEDEDGL